MSQTDRRTPEPATPTIPPAGPPPREGRTVPAGKAVKIVAVTLGLLVVFDARGMRHTADGMTPGTTRTLILAVARPADAVTHFLGLDRPGAWVSSALGHPYAPKTTSELLGSSAGAPSAAAPGPAASTTGGAGAATGRRAAAAGGVPAAKVPNRPAPRPAAVLPPLRRPTAAAPLRLLVTGDSLTDSIPPPLVALAHGTIHVDIATHYGTGLVRPDYFDWAAAARTEIATDHPEAVLLALGANDGQGFTMPGGDVLPAGTAAWRAEYTRRAVILMRILTSNGQRPLYWMTLPVARSDKQDTDYRELNAAIAAAARDVPRVKIVDVRTRLSNNGAYSAYLRDDSGRTVLARQNDGVHLTVDGARIAAGVLVRAIETDWHIGS